MDDVFGSLGLPTNYPDGQQVVLPANWSLQGNGSDDIEFAELDSVNYIHAVGGWMSLTLHNDTDIDFSDFEVQLLRRDVNDHSDFLDLVTLDYGQVRGDSTRRRSYFLADDTLTSVIRLRLNAEGNPQTITAFHDDALYFTMEIGTLKADFAEAVIGPQDPVTESDIIYLNDDFWVKEAVVDEAYIEYEVTNETDVNTMITMTFPRMFTNAEDDIPFSMEFDMARSRPGEPAVVETGQIDISGMVVRYDELPTELGTNQTFEIQTTTTIIGSGEISPGVPDFSLIRVGDSVTSTFTLSDLILLSSNGVPRSLTYESDPETIEIDMFGDNEQLQEDFAQKILLQQVQLIINVEKTVDAPIRFELDIEATNHNLGLSVDTTIVDTLERNEEQLIINNIANLINIVPDEFSISALVTTGYEVFGIPEVPYSMEQGDYILPSYRMEAPISLLIPEDTQLRPDVQEFEEPIDEGVNRLRLKTILENTIPTSGSLYLMAGKFASEQGAIDSLVFDNFQVYGLTFDLNGEIPEPLHISASPIDSDGRPTGVFIDTLYTEIPNHLVDLFSEEGVFTRQVLVLRATGDTPIVVKAEDYLNVTVVGEVQISINEE
ncbi:MAG TPA: hypothetical protein ENH10_07065 [Bacteroidetes bacterium]|nr:hypothetical protein [Bacteroidota bacterium]HEX04902.1 hypothetical protein [Bacteroidota bacterium]